MSDSQNSPLPSSVEASDQELTQQLRQIERRDWWAWGYSILVMLLLTFAVISFSLPALQQELKTFFNINDMHGHPAGDQVLQEFATHLNRVIRGSDLAVRLGGDEFLVLLPECTLEQLQLVLRRLGSLVVDWQGLKLPITFSAGWRQYQLGDRPEELLARADQALYASKRASKKAPALAKPVKTDADPAPRRG